MKKKTLTLLKIFIIISFSIPVFGQKFTIARIHYGGGGDWYSDPSSLPNLLNFVSENTHIIVDDEEVMQDFDGAIRLDSQYADAYYNRGIAYQHLGMTKEAESDFEKTKELGDRK